MTQLQEKTAQAVYFWIHKKVAGRYIIDRLAAQMQVTPSHEVSSLRAKSSEERFEEELQL